MNSIVNEISAGLVLGVATFYQLKSLSSVSIYAWVAIAFISLSSLIAVLTYFKAIRSMYFKDRILEVHPIEYEITREDMNFSYDDTGAMDRT